MPSQAHLISGTASFLRVHLLSLAPPPFPFLALYPFLPSPPPSPAPFPHFSAHALSWRPFSAFRHRPFPTSSAPSLPAPFGQIRPNRALGSVLFGRTMPEGKGRWRSERAGVGKPRRGAGSEGRVLGKGEKMPLFGPVWPNGVGREGVLEVEEGQCRKAEKGHRERAGAEE